MPCAHVMPDALQARQQKARWAPAQACQRLQDPWNEVVAAHALCLAEMQAGRHAEAYAAITSAVQPFIKVGRCTRESTVRQQSQHSRRIEHPDQARQSLILDWCTGVQIMTACWLADRAAFRCHRQAFQADATAWTLQPMLGFVRSLRSVAEAADAGLAKTGRRPEKLADCLDKLRKLFQAAQQASGDRRWS